MTKLYKTFQVNNHDIRYTAYQGALYFAFIDILEMLMGKRYSIMTLFLKEVRTQLLGYKSEKKQHPVTDNLTNLGSYKKLHQEIDELQTQVEELEEENEELLEEINELEDVLDQEIDYEREIIILERKREHAYEQLDKAIQAFGIATLMNTRLEIIGEEEVDFTVGL